MNTAVVITGLAIQLAIQVSLIAFLMGKLWQKQNDTSSRLAHVEAKVEAMGKILYRLMGRVESVQFTRGPLHEDEKEI